MVNTRKYQWQSQGAPVYIRPQVSPTLSNSCQTFYTYWKEKKEKGKKKNQFGTPPQQITMAMAFKMVLLYFLIL